MDHATTTAAPLSLEGPPPTIPARKRYRPPKAKFLADQSRQLDPISGCPDLQVPHDHAARFVLELVEQLDLKVLVKKYSALGRHGFHPKHVLGVLILGSVQGLHYASKLAKATKTDAAYRLVSGGRAISDSTIKKFRAENLAFFQDAVQQTVAMAVERGLIDPTTLAIDSARIQADASVKSMRTLERSKKRLEELTKEDVAALDEEAHAEHAAKVEKHETAVARCEAEGRTSHSVTDPHAGLLKFPSGAALPGHRVTVTSAGSDLRFVVNVLINATPNDFGMLEVTARGAHEALIKAGMLVREGAPRMQTAADPGYLSETDLTFAFENRDWLDVLIHEPEVQRRKGVDGAALFGRDAFTIAEDGTATCPAGLKMKGPYKNGDNRLWHGDGCVKCGLRERCTTSKKRALTQNPRLDKVRGHMHSRMAEPGAKARYNQRIATVEPVFSYIEDAMGFRRVSSRHTECLKAEILLKILAYNLMRLKAAKPVSACLISVVVTDDTAHIIDVCLPS
ncbi:MAG: transposase [Myxococcota bacterium]|jgi:transposase|nr:transposase [Myxococcota bacterium]